MLFEQERPGTPAFFRLIDQITNEPSKGIVNATKLRFINYSYLCRPGDNKKDIKKRLYKTGKCRLNSPGLALSANIV